MTLSSGALPHVDERMLNVGVGECVVSRLVFPVLPARADVLCLRDEPFFGDDLAANLSGARFCAYVPDVEDGSGSRVTGKAAWDSYTKMLSVSHGHLVRSEVCSLRHGIAWYKINLACFIAVRTNWGHNISGHFHL